MAIYKHGVYSELKSSSPDANTSLLNCPVYIGTLPIQRLNTQGAGFDYSQYINKPMLIESYNQINNLGIDSSNWDAYTLCEVIDAHLLNDNNAVSPFILINVLDPAKNIKSMATSKEVTLISDGANKVGYINDPICVIDDLAITAEPTISEGEYSVSYEGDRVKIVITKSGFSQQTINVTYKEIEVTEENLTSEMFKESLNAIDYCELLTGYIPNILAAPSFSERKDFHTEMINKVDKLISEKWRFICCSDIPSDSNSDTIDKAITWKKTNGYTSKYDKVCYPMVSYNNKKYHLSTIASFTMQATDIENGNTPHISPSNKEINADGVILKDGTNVFIFESDANKLNQSGITTVNIIRRRLRLWGQHMANYNFEELDSISYEDRSDAGVRMMNYILNYLQYEFIDNIDTPFSRKDIDSIITSVQQWLNSLVNENKLLYATVSFNNSDNATEDIVNGDFVFSVGNTLVPNAKSITFKVNYSKEGLSLLTASGGEE